MTTKRNAIIASALLMGLIGAGSAWAHGNVVPQAVETKGLTPVKDTNLPLDGDGWASQNPYRSSPEIGRAHV